MDARICCSRPRFVVKYAGIIVFFCALSTHFKIAGIASNKTLAKTENCCLCDFNARTYQKYCGICIFMTQNILP